VEGVGWEQGCERGGARCEKCEGYTARWSGGQQP
jgi:hypothetical protein